MYKKRTNDASRGRHASRLRTRRRDLRSVEAATRSILPAPMIGVHKRGHRGLALSIARRVAAGFPDSRLVLAWGSALRPFESIWADASRREAADLSPREADVLRLIATGKSNHQIAEALVISPHTVIRHVSNIFAKTGLANRTEAAVYATKHGFM